jgi:hypothetical protein
MIVFNECRIDSEGKYLIVEASVENLDYFKDVFIESIIVDTQDTYSESGPSESNVYSEEFKDSPKNIRVRISLKELKVDSLNDNIFFVYIGAGGVPASGTPCGMDDTYTMCIAVNLRPIYNMAMSYIKELEKTCETPKGFIDMILRLKAFELSLKTGNFTTAFKQWDKLKNKSIVPSHKGCGCHGTY